MSLIGSMLFLSLKIAEAKNVNSYVCDDFAAVNIEDLRQTSKRLHQCAKVVVEATGKPYDMRLGRESGRVIHNGKILYPPEYMDDGLSPSSHVFQDSEGYLYRVKPQDGLSSIVISGPKDVQCLDLGSGHLRGQIFILKGNSSHLSVVGVDRECKDCSEARAQCRSAKIEKMETVQTEDECSHYLRDIYSGALNAAVYGIYELAAKGFMVPSNRAKLRQILDACDPVSTVSPGFDRNRTISIGLQDGALIENAGRSLRETVFYQNISRTLSSKSLLPLPKPDVPSIPGFGPTYVKDNPSGSPQGEAAK